MALKKDKQKVIGEELSDERILETLSAFIASGLNDFDLIVRAYRHFRLHDFERFLDALNARALPLNPSNAANKDIVTYLNEHANGKAYAQAVQSRV